MSQWLTAALVAAVVAAVALSALRRQAWRHGLFERSPRTTRSRRDRRTTLGGPILVVATILGAVAGHEFDAPFRATVAVGVVLLATSWRAEHGRGPEWLVGAGRVAAAAAVPLSGIRGHLTGVHFADGVLTAAFVLAALTSFASLGDQDGVAPAAAGATAAAATALAIVGHQADVEVVMAALMGACAGVLVQAFRPATTTVGRTGGAFAGAVLAMGCVALDTPIAEPTSLIVPPMLLGLPIIAAGLAVLAWARRPGSERAIHLDRRLALRGFHPGGVVLLVAGAQALLGVLTYAVADGRLDWKTAVGAGAAVMIVVLVLAFGRQVHRTPAVGLPRSVRLALVGGIGLVVVLGVYDGYQAVRAKSHLEAGRAAAEKGLDAARAGDVDVAHAQFSRSHREFQQAHDLLDSPIVGLGRAVPVVSQNVRGVRTVTDVGLDLAETGEQLATRAGADEMRVRDGVFPVEQSRAIANDLDHAIALLDASAKQLSSTSSPFLASQVQDAIKTLDAKMASVRGEVVTVDEAARLAPSLFGGDGPRRYFLAVETPDELRGSGGILGNFGEVTAENGKLHLPRIERTNNLIRATDPARQATLLPDVYRTQYSGFAADQFWQNITAPADFPTVAQAIEAAYPATDGGQPVDGVIAVDPIGLAACLKLTGPVSVKGWPDPITAGNAERILLLDQYNELTGDARDDFLGDVAHAVFDKLTSGELPQPSKIVDTLAPAVAAGHIRLHSTRADEQQLFTDIGAAGALPPVAGDAIQLSTENGSESKIDYYLHRSLDYAAVVNPDTGRVYATATITLHNDAPGNGVSNYIIGGENGNGPTAPGENRLFVTFYSPFALDTALLDGADAGVNSNTESGRFAYTVPTRIPPGGTQTLVLQLHGDVPAGASYSLAVGLQPTVNPDHVSLDISEAGGSSYQFVTGVKGQMTQWTGDLIEPLRLLATKLP